MLLRFQVSNFASIRGELELSLVALDQHPDLAVTYVPGEDLYALPAVGIFGANASGKSNIIKAIRFARDAVRCSHRWRPDDPIPRWPFHLDHESRHQPGEFAFDLVAAGMRYTYGFALDDTAIHHEWLYAYPHGQRQVYLQRDHDAFRFGPRLAGIGERTAQAVRPNSLFLSAAGNHPQLDLIRRWFVPTLAASVGVRAAARSPGRATDDRTLALTRFADLEPVKVRPTHPNAQGCVWPGQHTRSPHFGDPCHGAGVLVPREPTSAQTWRHLLSRVLPALDTGALLMIDDLGAGLHPLLVAQVIRWFHDPAINRHRAQLIFNSHHTGLFGRHLGVQLARDQIWLTEKDQHGATRLFPLTEFQIPDDLDDIEGRYLQGRYGAGPFFDDDLLAALKGPDELG